MQMKLGDIYLGEQVRLVDIPQNCPVRLRLAQFGLGPGSQVRCRCFSPGHHLVALEWEGTVLAVRRKDLMGITALRC